MFINNTGVSLVTIEKVLTYCYKVKHQLLHTSVYFHKHCLLWGSTLCLSDETFIISNSHTINRPNSSKTTVHTYWLSFYELLLNSDTINIPTKYLMFQTFTSVLSISSLSSYPYDSPWVRLESYIRDSNEPEN